MLGCAVVGREVGRPRVERVVGRRRVARLVAGGFVVGSVVLGGSVR